jgi:uncharacterized NAD(P)/FAD-binding protein YdhS
MHPDGCRIAVIGAGFSGVMTAIHLLWRCKPGERVYLVERSGRIGPGLAYSPGHQRHLVNVRAENMSAFADEPGHFARWLEGLPPAEQAEAGERTIAGTFVRRSVYGRYVQDLLREAIARQDGADNLYIVADQATALRPVDGRLQLETESGRSYAIDVAVLATGNQAPARPALPGYVANPWSEAATAPLKPDRPVVLLGTGLTMADVCLSLMGQGFAGPIHAISRRGLLPMAHAPSSPWPGLRLSANDRRSLLRLFRAVRREVRRAERQGVGWRGVVDALRPHVQTLWAEMTTADKARFLRHVRPWWDVHRHRMAPPVTARLAALRAAGTLAAHAGRIVAMTPVRGALRVEWRPRGQAATQAILAQRVIDCTGLAGDYTRIDDPLVQQLLADGLVRPATLELGFDCTAHGAMIDAQGQPSRQIFGVGPVTRGALFEITAVPEIRAQAEQVAGHVLALARRRFAAAA